MLMHDVSLLVQLLEKVDTLFSINRQKLFGAARGLVGVLGSFLSVTLVLRYFFQHRFELKGRLSERELLRVLLLEASLPDKLDRARTGAVVELQLRLLLVLLLQA